MLHIVREGGGLGCPCGLMRLKGLLGTVEGVREHVIVLGRQAILDECQELGIEGVERVGTPSGSGVAGYWAIKRRVKELAASGGEIGLVSCDDVGVLWATERAMPRAKKMLWMSKLPVGRRLWWLKKYFRKHGASRCVVMVSTEAFKGQLAKLGLAGDYVRVVGVGVDERKLVRDAEAIQKLRVKWGAVGEDKDCFVTAILSDRPIDSDTRVISLAGGTASIVMQAKLEKAWQMRVLINPTHMHRDRSVTLTDEFGHVGLLVQESGTSRPWEIAAACDALVVVGTSSEDSLGWACASGKPVLVENNERLRELVGGSGIAPVLFDGDDLRKPSDQLTVWAQERGDREACGAAGQAWAKERFGLDEQRKRYMDIVKEMS